MSPIMEHMLIYQIKDFIKIVNVTEKKIYMTEILYKMYFKTLKKIHGFFFFFSLKNFIYFYMSPWDGFLTN